MLSFTHTAFAKWDKLFTCDNGKVHVDVDSEQRTRVQLVIARSDAAHYLYEVLNMGFDYYSGGEVGVKGYQARGVFHRDDFVGAETRMTYNLLRQVGNEKYLRYTESAYFYREGTGLKVEVIRTNIEKCEGYNGRFGTCAGSSYIQSQYAGNWYFPGCY
jgi:hypothetical protein